MENKENAIEVRNITKSFKVYYDKGSQLKEKILFKKRNKFENRQVLKGISFDVKKGEAIGLIGHNGCGKSTTLKLLTRIIYPDSGTIEMNGRVSSLIELGAGFHPDMSGRENIYTNAAIFGLTRKEIDARLDDIITFSELEDYIDNPVRTYSSGMYMRLAFSVAINVDADILLIDEILAVGDISFQAKCFNKLREIKANGTTIVIVSHSLGQVEQICDRSIWINEGRIKEEGHPRYVHPKYLIFMNEKTDIIAQKEKKQIQNNGKYNSDKRWGSGEVEITSIKLCDENGDEKDTFYNSEKIKLEIDYKATKELDNVVIGVAIYRTDQLFVYGTNTLVDYSVGMNIKENGTVYLQFESLPLIEGTYTVDIAFHRPDGFNYDFMREAVKIRIKNKTSEAGIVSINHTWQVD